MLQTLLPFLGACLLVAMSPGPSTVLIIRRSLVSRRDGMATVLGNETGVFVWGVVAAFGLTALLTASQLAYDALRVVGAVVLVVFGVQALRSARRITGTATAAGEAAGGPSPARPSAWGSYRAGLALNLANPKAAVFALSFLPQFVPAGAPKLPVMVALAALWAVFEVGYYACYVWGVGRMRRLIDRASVRRRLEQVSGGVLIALGVRMALEG
ncbi:MAG TPA: LysE family translocator [Streptomyces sp.]|uniref:LysE family translocator n=1 Tax=Streptomyces sp. TaxID=1931 RepID=UPI002D58E640|nr:LysE family translocator [Streptomyces sp.]HZG04340.1 LysE family translocator [Streptomyces sp.]